MKEIKKFLLRFTTPKPDLKKYLEGQAKKNKRSLNSEIIHRLEKSI